MNGLLASTFALLASLAPALANAEHRVALLVGNSRYDEARLATPALDLQSLAKGLEKYGVRCEVLIDLPGDQLKLALDAFASSTPTRGTAVVFFSGQVLPGNYNGKDGTFLAGTNTKPGDVRAIGNAGYSLELLLDRLTATGGASVNLVVVDAAQEPPAYDCALPNECLLAFAREKSLVTKLTGTADLIADVRSASSWSDDNIPPNVTIAGEGSSIVSPSNNFSEGQQAGDEWVNSRGMVFCWCPPGSYVAGSPESESGRYPDEQLREVVIDHGFWISKYELTLRENLRSRPGSTIAKHKNDPLTMINLDDAKRMTIGTLSDSERQAKRLPADWEYTLPTEEQWEYAARAGTTSRYYFGDDPQLLPQHANFGDKSYYDSQDIYSNAAHRKLNDGSVKLAIVGSYQPNPWGLHDVYGNVAEWCLNSAIRGGSWASSPEYCRSAYRDTFSSRNEQNFIGYRLVIQRASRS